MRDIYLIDFENVASEGLSGITYLSEDDQVIIFYSNNSNRLTMKMHILIGKSVCNMEYVEVTVGGKNALDHQISTWLGFLVGTGAAERNYYIVSRDTGYRHVANFWAANGPQPKVRCIDAIKVAGRLERNRLNRLAEAEAAAAAEAAQERAQLEQEQNNQIEVPQQEIVAENAEPAVIPAVVEAEAQTAAEESGSVVLAEPEAMPAEAAKAEATEEAEVCVEALSAMAETTEQEAASAHTSDGGEPEHRNNRRNRGTAKNRRSKSTKSREPETKGAEQPKADETKKVQPMDQLPVLIAPYPKLQEAHLRDLIAANKKQILCNTLRKQLGQEKGLALYNDIKRIAWR